MKRARIDKTKAERCIALARATPDVIAKEYPDMDESLLVTYALNAMLLATLELAAKYRIPVGAMLQAVTLNYPILEEERHETLH